jgi:hypothetical protein
MTDENQPTIPSEPTATDKPKRKASPQDQASINRINEYHTRLIAVKANRPLADLLQARGYDDAGLDEGLAVIGAAQMSFNAIESTRDDYKQAAVAVRAADKDVRLSFANFRKIVGGAFKDDPAAKSALKATGRIPADQQQFFSYADGAYENALKRPYITVLGKRGYTPGAIAAERAKLTALTAAIAGLRTTEDAKKNTVRQRTAAVKAANRWWAEFSAVADVVTQDQSQWRGQLGL